MGIHYIEDNELKKITDAIKEKNRIETFNGADMAQEIRRNPMLNKIITNDASTQYSITEEDLKGCSGMIRSYAFYGCAGLTSIVIPKEITSINNNVFYNCKDLYSVEFKGNIKNMGINCFKSCENLQKLILRGNTVPKTTDSTLLDTYMGAFTPSMAGIYVPSNLIEQYQNTTVWKDFFMLIKPLEQADEELETW